MPLVADTQIPRLVEFFGRISESLQLLVKEVHHTNALLFNLGADVTENTKLDGDVENLLFKICRSRGLLELGGVTWGFGRRNGRGGENTDAGVVAEDRRFMV